MVKEKRRSKTLILIIGSVLGVLLFCLLFQVIVPKVDNCFDADFNVTGGRL